MDIRIWLLLNNHPVAVAAVIIVVFLALAFAGSAVLP